MQVLPQWKDFSVHLHSAQVLTAIRCRIQDNTLDMHIFLRSILKHWSMTLTFLIIEELVGPLVAVYSRNVTDCLCWVVHCEAYFLNQRLAQALFNSNFLTVFYLLFNNNTLICFGGSCKAAWVSASVMMFELQKFSRGCRDMKDFVLHASCHHRYHRHHHDQLLLLQWRL